MSARSPPTGVGIGAVPPVDGGTSTSTSRHGTRECGKPVITACETASALRRRASTGWPTPTSSSPPATPSLFDPHTSVGQVVAIEGHRPQSKKMPVEAVMRMAFYGQVRAHGSRAGLRARHDLRDRRPARLACASGPRSWPRPSPGTPPAANGPPPRKALVGSAGDRTDRRLQAGRLQHLVSMWGPPRSDRGPGSLRRAPRPRLATAVTATRKIPPSR